MLFITFSWNVKISVRTWQRLKIKKNQIGLLRCFSIKVKIISSIMLPFYQRNKSMQRNSSAYISRHSGFFAAVMHLVNDMKFYSYFDIKRNIFKSRCRTVGPREIQIYRPWSYRYTIYNNCVFLPTKCCVCLWTYEPN